MSTPPKYQDYKKRKMDEGEPYLDEKAWARKVLHTGPKTEQKFKLQKTLDKVLGDVAPKKLTPGRLQYPLQVIKNRLEKWDRVGEFVEGSKEEHEEAKNLIEKEIESQEKHPERHYPKEKPPKRDLSEVQHREKINKQVEELLAGLSDEEKAKLSKLPEWDEYRKTYWSLTSTRQELETAWRSMLREFGHQRRKATLVRVAFRRPALRRPILNLLRG